MLNTIEKRLPWILCAGLASGICASFRVEGWFICAIFLILFSTFRGRMILLGATLAGFALGLISATKPIDSKLKLNEVVTIASVPRIQKDGFTADVRTSAGLIRMSWPAPELTLGDRAEVVGTVKGLGPDRPPWSPHVGRLHPDRLIPLREGNFLFRWGIEWRRSFVNLMNRSMPAESAQTVQALCFNVDDPLDDEFLDKLQRTGTIHLISASGLHVLLFALALQALAKLLPIPRSVQIGLVLAILVLYSVGAGLRPPIVRSVIMSGLALSAYQFKREADWFHALGVSVLVQLLWKPLSLFEIGFQLSVVTVAALTLYAQGIDREKWKSYWGPIKAGFTTSIVAWLASLPLVAYYFGNISLIAPIANAIVGVLVGPILVLSLSMTALSGLLPGVSGWVLGACASPMAQALRGWIIALGTPEYVSLPIPAFHPWILALVYGGALIAWRPNAKVG